MKTLKEKIKTHIQWAYQHSETCNHKHDKCSINTPKCSGMQELPQDLESIMSEIAEYTKRVIGSNERWELNDGTARSITERNELRSEQHNRAKEEGIEL